MHRILLVNGPNLNLLGRREPGWYGDATLPAIEARLAALARERGAVLETFQSNAEHELVDRIQALATAPVDFAIVNPGAFTHTSIALRDALLAVAVPFIEVHLSNVHARESWRSRSVLAGACAGGVYGFGADSYRLALLALARLLDTGWR